jgi:uncharacterized repeat protein (TIGR04138 family)
MHTGNFDEILDQILLKDARFHRDAYFFLREGLDYTQKLLAKGNRETREGREAREGAREASGESPKEEGVRHVSGRELLEGIRALALEQFGPMACSVLEEWGVRRCEDFGEIVFNMVDNHLLAKTKDDTREDFSGAYDFDEAFRQPFLPSSQRKAPAPTPASAKTPKA